MADAWFSKDAVLTIEAAGAGTTTSITGEVTSFSQTGGTEDTSDIAVFGGGIITKEETPDQIEVQFEIIPYDDLWPFSSRYGAAVTTNSVNVVTSDGTRLRQRVTITWAVGFDSASPKVPNSGKALRYTYVNCLNVSVDPSEDADGEQTATVTLKLSKTDADANPQFVVEQTDNAAANAFDDPYGDNNLRVAFNSYTYT